MDKINERAITQTSSHKEDVIVRVEIEREVPRGGQTDVVIAVVIRPVVDVEAVRVEVADVHAVAVRGNEIACSRQCHRKLRFTLRI